MPKPIRIHHFSDLHFGIFQRTAGIAKHGIPSKQLAPADLYLGNLEFLRKSRPEELPDFVVISGDLTSIAAEGEFDQAEQFVRNILELIVDKDDAPDRRERIVIVPGNHDFSYKTLDAADGKEGRKKALQGLRRRFRERFKDFLLPYAAGSTASADTHSVRCRGSRLTFICIDSNDVAGYEREDIKERLKKLSGFVARLEELGGAGQEASELQDGIARLKKLAREDPGAVDPADIASLHTRVSNDDWKASLRILVQHHPIVAVETRDAGDSVLFNSGAWISTVQKLQPHLMLSGHTHAEGFVYERRLSATTRADDDDDAAEDGDDWATFAIVAGTFGGDGDDPSTYLDMEFYPLPEPENCDGWYCRSTTREAARKIKRRSRTSFYVERKQTLVPQFDVLHERRALKGGGEDSAAQAFKRLSHLLQTATQGPTLQPSLVTNTRYQKFVDTFDRMYAIDIQAFDAWLDPTVYYYFATQIPRYLAATYQAGDWTLRLTPLLLAACERARENADEDDEGLEPKSTLVTSATLLPLGKPRDPQSQPPSLEMARILLWSEADLVSPDGRAVVSMHEALRIPLFYLSREDAVRHEHYPRNVLNGGWSTKALERAQEFEYIYFTRGDACLGGMWVDLDRASTRRDRLFQEKPAKPKPINRLGSDKSVVFEFHPRDHFQILLQNTRLRFAVDAIEQAKYRRSRS